tara:strand:+ start:469 stop:687 length:219 start_codon:yes stop_codon:yes gene_type:complete
LKTGDLVKVTMLGSELFGKVGLIVDYVDWDSRYHSLRLNDIETISYKIRLGDSLVMVRSKWVELVAEKKDVV